MERWYTRAIELRKKFLHTEKHCSLCEDLVPVSKNKLTVFGKSQLDLGAYTESTVWEIQKKHKNGISKQSNRRKIRLFSQATTTYINYAVFLS